MTANRVSVRVNIDIDWDALADELFERQGFVAIATFGSSPIYRVGDTVASLWSHASRRLWRVTGKATKELYIEQQYLVRRLHPEWDDKAFEIRSERRPDACYYGLEPVNAR